MASTVRLAGVGLAVSAWMVLLFSGRTLGGAVHLLLAGALLAFPWRELRPLPPADADDANNPKELP